VRCFVVAGFLLTSASRGPSAIAEFLVKIPAPTAKFERDHPLWGRQMQVGWVKIRHFRRKIRYNSKTVLDA